MSENKNKRHFPTKAVTSFFVFTFFFSVAFYLAAVSFYLRMIRTDSNP